MRRMTGSSRSQLVVMAMGLFLTAGTVRAAVVPGRLPTSAVATSTLATHAIESGGVERTYAAHVPENDAGAAPRRLLLEIHGSGSDPEQQRHISGLAGRAGESGVIVLFPVAVVPGPAGATWNVPHEDGKPDDVRYLLDIVDDATRRYGADGTRVFVVGFSGGARLASELAARHGDRVAALAAVGGLRAPGTDGPPVPVIAFHGTSDPVNPWRGGGPAYWGYGVERAMEGWAERNGCTDLPWHTVSPAVVRRACLDGEGSAPVVLYRFVGGHVWPGSAFPFSTDRFGTMPDELDATRLLIEFFERRGLRGSLQQAGSAKVVSERIASAGRSRSRR